MQFLASMPGHRHLRPFFEQVNHDPLTIVTVAASGLQMMGTIAQGNASRAMADNQAAQLRQQAGETRASSQRAAMEERRKGIYASSRAQALQAAGGADPESKTAITNEANLTGAGEYGALTAMFNGEERARSLEMGASNKMIEGQQAHQAGVISGISTFGKTIGSMYGSSMLKKYGEETIPGLDGGASDTTGDWGQ